MKKAIIEALGLGLFRVTWQWEAEWLVLAPADGIEKVREVAEGMGFRDVDPDDDAEVSVSDEIKRIEKWAIRLKEPERFDEPDASLVDDWFVDVETLLDERLSELLSRLYKGGNIVCDSCGYAGEFNSFVRGSTETALVCPQCRDDINWLARLHPVTDDKTMSLFKEE